MVFDFASRPPEVNSALIYSPRSGSGPVTAGMTGHSKPASSQLVAGNVDLSYYLCT